MAKKTIAVSAALMGNFRVESEIRGHRVVVDQPLAAGGENAGPSPLEFACLSLAACVISIGQIIAKQRRIALRGLTATVEAEVEPDVYMGKSTDIRAGFLSYRVMVNIDADLSEAEKRALLADIDHRCPVSENLQHSTPVVLELV